MLLCVVDLDEDGSWEDEGLLLILSVLSELPGFDVSSTERDEGVSEIGEKLDCCC